MKTFLLTCVLSLGVAVSGAAAGEPIPSGQLIGHNCAACHGTDGREFHESMPPLAGMDVERFVAAMNAFKDGTRPAIIMDRVAKAFGDEAIRAVAEFYAAQPPVQYGAEAKK